MKKIWICGAGGMLGSHFERLLREKGVAFVANDSKQVDITDLEAVSNFVKAQKVSHIINCAAYTQVDKAESEQALAYQVNAIGPYHLGLVAKKQGARVIHFSTDYVFDGSGKKPFDETHPCSPLGAYGMSKFAGELKLLDVNPRACIIRTSWLFGLPGKNFVETMLRLMEKNASLRVVSDQTGRPTFCQDLAEAAFALCDEEGVFHFANASETSWYEFSREIYRQGHELGLLQKTCAIEPIPAKDYPTPAQRPAYSTLNTAKVESVLGYAPRAWQDALRDYLTQYKNSQTLQV